MVDFEYEYPETLELVSGQEIVLTQNDLKDERTLAIVIPQSKTWEFASFLYDRGFSNAEPAWYQGEKYGLSRIIKDPWEMHVRIFENGYIYPHIELRRDYLEHLDQRYTWPVYDEIMEYVKRFTDSFGLVYLKTDQWVQKIVTKAKVVLSPPKSLTEWKPVVYFAGGMAAGVALTIGLVKLFEYLGKDKES